MNRIINSSLSKAIYNNDIEKLRHLLNLGKRTDIQDNTGWTPLHCAVQKNRLDMVELILAQFESSINVRCFEGETPLFVACSSKCDHRIVSALLIAGADPNISNNEDVTPLHIITDLTTAELLLTFGANINNQDFNKYTPLHCAVEKQNIELINFLIDAGADTSLREINGLNPLMLSFQHDLNGIEKLVDTTVDVNCTAFDGWSTLMLAINGGKISIAFKLLKRGADIGIVAENLTPLHLAVMKQEEELFKCLWNKVDYSQFKQIQSLPHLMLIHRWYVPERIEYLLKVLELPEIFSNERNPHSFLEFLFRFERDNKLELVICDILTRIVKTIAPSKIAPCLISCFIEKFSNCKYKFTLLDILINSGIADFQNKNFTMLACELDPEIVPKLLTLTLALNPACVYHMFVERSRMDIAVLTLMLTLLNYCTLNNSNHVNFVKHIHSFNLHSAKRVKYSLRVDANTFIQTYRIVEYEITSEDREIMCDLYSKIDKVTNVYGPPSLKELSRDCIRHKLYLSKRNIKQCEIGLNKLGLPKDLIDVLFLKRPIYNHFS